MQGNAALDPGVFDGRLLVEIEAWDWALDVRLSPDVTPMEHRFQGGINYSRPIIVTGRLRAPELYRGKSVRLWITPFGPELSFDSDLDRVGKFQDRSKDQLEYEFEGSLYLPESALGPTLTSLAAKWKFVHIWTDEQPADVAYVTAFSFSASIPPRVTDWAGEELLFPHASA